MLLHDTWREDSALPSCGVSVLRLPHPHPSRCTWSLCRSASVDSHCAGVGRGSPLLVLKKKMTQTVHRSHSFPAGFQECHSNINGLSY